MSDVFGAVYSSLYDTLYLDKNYSMECDLVEHIFREYGNYNIKSILDLGCGTGNHAILMAKRGYEVMGVDRSKDMLRSAKDKAKSLSVKFVHGDIKNLELNNTFDAVLMMFAVIGYQLENWEVISTLRVARKNIKLDGLIIFDFWYGPAVLAQKPSDKIRIIPRPNGKIIRLASSNLDILKQICTVSYQMWELEADKLVNQIAEDHKMRFFFPRELELLLSFSGFKLLNLRVFPRINEEPNEQTWNVVAIAKAIEGKSQKF